VIYREDIGTENNTLHVSIFDDKSKKSGTRITLCRKSQKGPITMLCMEFLISIHASLNAAVPWAVDSLSKQPKIDKNYYVIKDLLDSGHRGQQ
jgi:hypothetical protein